MVKRWFRHTLMLALLGATLPAATALAQAPECTPRILNRASTMYDLGRYDSTILLLRPCLEQERFSNNEDEQAAYRLVALSYFENNDLELAKDWIRRLVREYREYVAIPATDPPFFQHWIDTYRPKKWYQKSWVRLGALAVVGGTTTYLLTRPGDAPVVLVPRAIPPLPLPPPVDN